MAHQFHAEEHALDDRHIAVLIPRDAGQRLELGDQTAGGLKAAFMVMVADRVQHPGVMVRAFVRIAAALTRSGGAHHDPAHDRNRFGLGVQMPLETEDEGFAWRFALGDPQDDRLQCALLALVSRRIAVVTRPPASLYRSVWQLEQVSVVSAS